MAVTRRPQPPEMQSRVSRTALAIGVIGRAPTKKAGARPAFRYSVCRSWRSVFGDDRATPAVVDADCDEIDILTDAGDIEHRAGDTGDAVAEQGVGLILHEQMIVFDRGRPVRGEAVFEADADCAAPPADIAAVGDFHRDADAADPEAISRHSRTALDVEQHVVGGVADLTGEGAE